ncbi:MAG: hypothetical protein GY777_16960 [Candidatus Brocadiaceae bacterium]|nr:hypothetical protein [Candidatus Brocadiaceae bacterium]
MSPLDLEAAIGRSPKTVEQVVLMSDDDFELWASYSINSLPDSPQDNHQGPFRGQNFQAGGVNNIPQIPQFQPPPLQQPQQLFAPADINGIARSIVEGIQGVSTEINGITHSVHLKDVKCAIPDFDGVKDGQQAFRRWAKAMRRCRNTYALSDSVMRHLAFTTTKNSAFDFITRTFENNRTIQFESTC